MSHADLPPLLNTFPMSSLEVKASDSSTTPFPMQFFFKQLLLALINLCLLEQNHLRYNLQLVEGLILL